MGIYELDGDRLKICLARHRLAKTEQRRPRHFAVEPSSADVLFVLERTRPSEDEKALYGHWAIVQLVENGRPIPEEKNHAKTCWLSGENGFSMNTGAMCLRPVP